jgi:hypothetical protein
MALPAVTLAGFIAVELKLPKAKTTIIAATIAIR